MNWSDMQDFAPGHYHPRKRYERNKSEQARTNANLREPGEVSLCVAIIEQALADYFTLVRAGAIRFGTLRGKWREYVNNGNQRQCRYVIRGLTQTDAMALLDFLRNLDTFADHIELKRDWRDAWPQILHLERTRNYFRAFVDSKTESGGVDEPE